MIQNILIKIMKEFFISILFGIGLGCMSEALLDARPNSSQ
jgi:hypothetical protein